MEETREVKIDKSYLKKVERGGKRNGEREENW